MKISFWSSTQYSGFLEGLMREFTAAGLDAQQCYHISEVSYRSAKSIPARLFLRFRQYVVYPIQLCAALLWQRIVGVKRARKGSDHSESPRPGESVTFPQPGGERLTSDLCILSSGNDVCVVSTNTFYAPLLATLFHKRVVHLVYDLFPEAMIYSGKWREGTLKVKLIHWITKLTLKRVRMNVFLGKRLKDYAESIYGPVPNAAIIAVGADQSLFPASPKQRLERLEVRVPSVTSRLTAPQIKPLRAEKAEDAVSPSNLNTFHSSRSSEVRSTTTSHLEPKILYCGNFGNMHDSETLFSLWRECAQRFDGGGLGAEDFGFCTKMSWSFLCSGPKRAALEVEVAQLPDVLKSQIQLGGGLNQQAWIEAMESADVALVTMIAGSETVVMPSKVYSAMMAGQAILAIAPEDSDLVDLIKAADCGWWVAPGDVPGLAAMIDILSADSVGLLEKRANAYRYAHVHFGQDALAVEWKDQLRGLFADGC